MNSPIFIVGLPRTGSKWLMNVINQYTDACVIHELQLKSPWRKSALSRISDERARCINANSSSCIEQLLFDKTLFGSYWRATDHSHTVFVLNKAEVEDAIEEVCDEKSLMLAMMSLQVAHYSKKRMGARHPVHFWFSRQLLDWFPSARVLFMTRDPREIYRSKVAKIVKANMGVLHRMVMICALALHTLFQYFMAKYVLFSLKNDERIKVIDYQEMLDNPNRGFRYLCEHLGLPFDERMARDETVYDSSFDLASQAVPQ